MRRRRRVRKGMFIVVFCVAWEDGVAAGRMSGCGGGIPVLYMFVLGTVCWRTMLIIFLVGDRIRMLAVSVHSSVGK